MPPAHTHDHDHHHHGDESDETLTKAIFTFAVLGAAGLIVALFTGRIALAVDSFHNLCEAPILGINRGARRREGEVRSRRWTCCILPLAPAISAFAAIVVAALFLFVAETNEELQGVWLACLLCLMSVGVNAFFAKKLHGHHHHDHSDSNVITAKLHLIGDMSASGVAAVAYFVIGATQGNTWLDPAAAILGIGLIVGFHVRPIMNSVSEFRRHQLPGHTGCVNSPPPQC